MSLQEAGEAVGNAATSFVVYVGTPVASATLAVLGATDNTIIGTMLASLGSTGMMAWLIYYYVKVERPRLDKRQDAKDLATQKHYEGIIEKIETNDKEKNKEICKSLDGVATSLSRLACSHETPRQHDDHL